MAIRLDGKLLAQEILEDLARKISESPRAPCLAVVLVGSHPASQIYVKNKKIKAEKIGMVSHIHELPSDTSEENLLTLIQQLNHDKHVHGILIQLPLPKHIDKHKIIDSIIPQKDVDGFHPYHLGRLAQGKPSIRPCTPYGIIRLLNNYNIKLEGLNAVVVGASTIVGRPMALELLMAGSTVTVCHSKTKHLENHIKSADVIIAATGKRDLIKPEWIKKGAIVIDVGIHHLDNGEIVGDIDFDEASKKAQFITPVPGGVGPMTIAMLLENTYHASVS